MDGIGRYEVIRELGSGGMGQVFLARDPELERLVALKLLHANKAGLVSLREEARALAALSHPHIVTVYEIGQHDARPFIAMEYVGGRPLQQLLQHATHRPARDELVAICAKVARALAAAHAAGILHRDIKPENVLVGDAGQVKVVDFGVAQRLAEAPAAARRMTATERAVAVASELAATQPIGATTLVTAATRTLFGTPAYMAPEVLLGEPSSEASDVYSLGVVLYECLAGRRPHDLANLVEVIAQVIDGAPVERIADSLWDLVERMLASAPAARPGLDEIARRLERRRDPRRVQRARLRAVTFAAGVGIALVAGGAVAWRARASERAATDAATIAVLPIELDLPSFGHGTPAAHVLGDVLGKLLGSIPDIKVSDAYQFALVTDREALARENDVRYLVRGKLAERAGKVVAKLELVDLASRRATPIAGEVARIADLAQLLRGLADQIAARAVPGRQLAALPDRRTARELLRVGREHMRSNNWYDARSYLEQAVERDDNLFEAWGLLASADGWTIAPEEQLAFALQRAIELAPEGASKQLWRGASLMLRGLFPEAVATLQQLERPGALARAQERDFAYWYGEALFHDGQHDAAMVRLRHLLELDPRFQPAVIHTTEYALARRRLADAERAVGMQQIHRDRIEFAARHYAALAARAESDQQLYARLVLEQPVDDLEAKLPHLTRDKVSYRIARALDAGDVAKARRTFAEAWRALAAQPLTQTMRFRMVELLEVLETGQLTDEIRHVVALFHDQPAERFRHNEHAAELLIAPLVRARPPLAREGMTSRNRRLAVAMEAELAGDRARAAELLAQLIADPSALWDFPIRVALARNLHALRRTRELRALCADTLEPAIYRDSFLAARAACRTYLSAAPSR